MPSTQKWFTELRHADVTYVTLSIYSYTIIAPRVSLLRVVVSGGLRFAKT